MKDLFPGYYRPTEEEFSQLWVECLFVLDTNVLLNLYRYSPATRDELMGILTQLSQQLWVPWQVALEYQRNRLDVINRQLSMRDQIAKSLKSAKKDVISKVEEVKKLCREHPFLTQSDLSDLRESIETHLSQLIGAVEDWGQDSEALVADDDLREHLSSLLDGRIGARYSRERLEATYSEGKKRYARKTPPGYEDEKKEDDAQKYGDLVVWFQIIDHAKQVKKPIVFVTDDGKDDWWWQKHEKIIGPRPELVEEMLSKAGVRFYMYKTHRFIDRATKYLEGEANQQAIDEARRVAEQQAARTRVAAKGVFRLPSNLGEWEDHVRRRQETLRALAGEYQIPSHICRWVEEFQREQQEAALEATRAVWAPWMEHFHRQAEEAARRAALLTGGYWGTPSTSDKERDAHKAGDSAPTGEGDPDQEGIPATDSDDSGQE